MVSIEQRFSVRTLFLSLHISIKYFARWALLINGEFKRLRLYMNECFKIKIKLLNSSILIGLKFEISGNLIINWYCLTYMLAIQLYMISSQVSRFWWKFLCMREVPRSWLDYDLLQFIWNCRRSWSLLASWWLSSDKLMLINIKFKVWTNYNENQFLEERTICDNKMISKAYIYIYNYTFIRRKQPGSISDNISFHLRWIILLQVYKKRELFLFIYGEGKSSGSLELLCKTCKIFALVESQVQF